MKNKQIIPQNHTATESLRGNAFKIFEDVVLNDQVVIEVRTVKPKALLFYMIDTVD